MYQADLQHDDQSLEDKLNALYTLNREKTVDLSFRPPYLNLLEKFGNPHLNLPPVIHVAGTNGKGSSIAILRSCLEAMGLRVHCYTSPHLYRFNERIVLAGNSIDNKSLEDLIDEALRLNDGGAVTFFEVTTAMAFAAFSRVEADVVLLETGLGGRLDCTNVVEAPIATMISKISYDHTEYLGDTLADIAGEKAGIMKAGAPCIIGAQMDKAAVQGVFEARADALSVDLSVAGGAWSVSPDSGGMVFTYGDMRVCLPRPALVGAHQVDNAGVALATLYVLRERFGWDEAALARGLKNVRWHGRLERVSERVSEQAEIWFDGGHNDSAALALVAQLEVWAEGDDKELHLIVGMKGDKDPDGFLKSLLALCRSVSLVPLNGVGACVTAAQIEPLLAEHEGVTFYEYADITQALAAHVRGGDIQEKRILICGSLYLAAQIP